MRLFIFYTAEGYTEDPNGNEVCNCQMLGVASGNGIVSARDNLLKKVTGFFSTDLAFRRLWVENC